jgi:hypothetical protein
MKLEKMKKALIFSLLIVGLVIFGCKKPEVIPAPSSKADLKIHFEGIINGSDVEWTKNVEGYKAVSRKQLVPQSGGLLLDLSYYCGMLSDFKNSGIEVGLGALVQDPTLGTSPNMVTFRDFMDDNLTTPPDYSDSAKAGFEVRYFDENGRLFVSDETLPGSVIFSNYEEKEDNSGEYIQFQVNFGCVVKHWGKTVTQPIVDSVLATAVIQNAKLTGYFTR